MAVEPEGQTGKSLVPNDICNDHTQALVSQTILNFFLLTQDFKHLAFTLSSLLSLSLGLSLDSECL